MQKMLDKAPSERSRRLIKSLLIVLSVALIPLASVPALAQEQAPNDTPPPNTQDPLSKLRPLVQDAAEKAADNSVEASKAVAEAKDAAPKQGAAFAEPSTEASEPASSGTAPASSGTAPASSGTAPASSGTAPASSGTAPASIRSGSSNTEESAAKDNASSVKDKVSSAMSAPASSGTASSNAKESATNDKASSSAMSETGSDEGAAVVSDAEPTSRLSSIVSPGTVGGSLLALGTVLATGFLMRKKLLGWLGL